VKAVGGAVAKSVVEHYVKCRVKAVGRNDANAFLNIVLIVESRRWEGLMPRALLNIMLNVE
jgi:7,8-dihydro-6-hydroxymethylpterin-pyrophosphokinase